MPAAAADILSYLATRGHADGIGEVKDWTRPENYNAAVMLLSQLGTEMGIDPLIGTFGDPAVAAIGSHLVAAQIGGASARGIWDYTTATSGPSINTVVEIGLGGGLASVSAGSYNDAVDPAGNAYLDQYASHQTMVTGATTNGTADTGTITIEDPIKSHALDTVQSPYEEVTLPMGAPTVHRILDEHGNVVDAYLPEWNGNPRLLLTGVIAVNPARIWGVRGRKLVAVTPLPLLPDDPIIRYYEVTGGVADLALDPVTGQPVVLSSNGTIRIPSNGATPALRLPTTVVGRVAGAKQIAVGPGGTIYVATNSKLIAIPHVGARWEVSIAGGKAKDLLANPATGEVSVLAGRTLNTTNGQLTNRTVRKVPPSKGLDLVAGQVTLRRGAALRLASGETVRAAKGKLVFANAAGTPAPGRAGAGSEIGKLRAVFHTGYTGDPTIRLDQHQPQPYDYIQPKPTTTPESPTPSTPPPAVATPNLVVTRSTDPTTVPTIVVRNVGTAPAAASVLRIESVAGPRLVNIPALAPGQASDPVPFSCATDTAATADTSGVVAESDETDNTLTLTCS